MSIRSQAYPPSSGGSQLLTGKFQVVAQLFLLLPGGTTCHSLLAALEGTCNLCVLNMLRGVFASIDQIARLGFCACRS
jgi:hypothetical protein